jgi:hypothetical protein
MLVGEELVKETLDRLPVGFAALVVEHGVEDRLASSIVRPPRSCFRVPSRATYRTNYAYRSARRSFLGRVGLVWRRRRPPARAGGQRPREARGDIGEPADPIQVTWTESLWCLGCRAGRELEGLQSWAFRRRSRGSRHSSGIDLAGRKPMKL